MYLEVLPTLRSTLLAHVISSPFEVCLNSGVKLQLKPVGFIKLSALCSGLPSVCSTHENHHQLGDETQTNMKNSDQKIWACAGGT